MSNYNYLTMIILRRCRANYGELTSLINSLTAQGVRQFSRLEGNQPFPDPVVEGTAANHLRRLEQVMEFGIATAGVQRPFVFPYLLDDPADES